MSNNRIGGVIAAAVTPIAENLEPDLGRFTAWCRWLLDNGCDGLNLCGTTGEATSFSVAQRFSLMDAATSLPRERLMVGTGAAAIGDAVALTRHAAELGFAGALVLPPFYYKGVDDDGIIRYIERLVRATTEQLDIYLYNFPAMTGVTYSPALVKRLAGEFGKRLAGVKDSSGDMTYAAKLATENPEMSIFPSNEGVLLDARAGKFAGCISASANINSQWCAKAFHTGDVDSLRIASDLRRVVSQHKLIPSIKAMIARNQDDPNYEALMPPLVQLNQPEKRNLFQEAEKVLTHV